MATSGTTFIIDGGNVCVLYPLGALKGALTLQQYIDSTLVCTGPGDWIFVIAIIVSIMQMSLGWNSDIGMWQ
jgi:hypothetical protein